VELKPPCLLVRRPPVRSQEKSMRRLGTGEPRWP
jgi:hypothetical protein